MRVLIVEDNRRLAALICDELNQRGFASDRTNSLQQAEEAMALVRYDALVLDLGLPDGDGVEWLRARSPLSAPPPVLILTARSGLGDRVSGLDAGADDYLSKPFEMDELAARLRALMRRPGARGNPVMRVGPLAYDAATRTAALAARPLQLSRRETDFLEVMMRQAGTAVSRAAIEDAIYSFNEPVTPNAIEATASRLRRKLEEAGGANLLHTIRGIGYILEEWGR